ncbi:PEP-CTERM sorting domain-containing protein [Accumulibacter sp.]|uniref:PEP-CTERM sorting domain-containing protein n=1 Tax=Accumulibacter sp. TaxID=2053492 RepID=UPI0025F995F8|nr:PEP-CTERM sorting domain-containing protein [Accumulibacter sp.]MCM8595911.1 PEP-CTERM sorting domain-containing protein [Accumulibacter sp.]MCM8624514.1 PEP-CTERM sorting domain-containing protein [Accumulibacter sp.]MDS4050060.1 PEP-CTERM sorting domain-containing protein [Accumulibacter sp.]
MDHLASRALPGGAQSMGRKLARFGAAGALCVLSATAFGAPVNQGFEAGLAGWTTLGDVSTQTSATVVTFAPFPNGTTWTVSPIQTRMAQLVSNNGVDLNPNIGALDAFFGLASQTINQFLQNAYGITGPAWNGSGIKQSFSGSAGDVVEQYWNFFSTEDVNWQYADGTNPNDAAFYVITDPNGLQTIDFLRSGALASNTQSVGPAGSSGWRAFDYTLPASGNYTIGFGVVNWRDGYFDAELFLDAGKLPEPASLALLGMGLAGVGLLRRRRTSRGA